MSAHVGDPAVVHDNYQVGVLDRRHALRDDDLRRLRNVFPEPGTDQSVSLCVDRACRVVQDEYLRLSQQGTRNAETLLPPCSIFVSYPSGKERTNSSA